MLVPEHLKPLARHWLDNRPAARTRTRPVAARPAPVPVAVYNPAPSGFSQEEWEEFGFQEFAARRAHRIEAAARYALQRGRNRWRRKAGRAA